MSCAGKIALEIDSKSEILFLRVYGGMESGYADGRLLFTVGFCREEYLPLIAAKRTGKQPKIMQDSRLMPFIYEPLAQMIYDTYTAHKAERKEQESSKNGKGERKRIRKSLL